MATHTVKSSGTRAAGVHRVARDAAAHDARARLPGATARVGRLDFIGGLIFIEAQRCPLRYLGFTDTFLDHVRPYQEQGAYTVLSCKLYVSF